MLSVEMLCSAFDAGSTSLTMQSTAVPSSAILFAFTTAPSGT
jgi:hypothetical protein